MPWTSAFLAGHAIRLHLSEGDLQHALSGKPLVQAVFLPAGETLVGEMELCVNSRLLPAGGDAIAEAARRGAILAVLRLEAENAEAGPVRRSGWRGRPRPAVAAMAFCRQRRC